MARKNLLVGLMEPATTATPVASPAPTAIDPARPRFAKGAVGAISRSVAELQSRALIDIDANLIDAAGMPDRLGSEAEDDAALRESIAEYGQQLPVLVRPHPTEEGRYQIVYGRRRVQALRELGRPVKALVRQLDDRDLIMAQGQENTARRDLSFIEKANFAYHMELGGYDRKLIGDTLSTDKTLISRLLSVIERVPFDVIHAIGAAPSIGRERWLALADALEAGKLDARALAAQINEAEAKTSDERFEVALRLARGQQTPPDRLERQWIRDASGTTLAEVQRSGGRLTIRLDKKIGSGFEDWLLAELPDLHRKWSAKKKS